MLRFLTTLLACTLFAAHANALEVNDLTNAETTKGLKAALIQAAEKAVAQLSKTDGYLGNSEVKIPLPDSIKKTEKAMRMLGMGKHADELVLRMNRAAEAAVPEAKALLVNAVKQMSVADAKAILTGGNDAATQYFKKVTSKPMAEKFLPIVKKATADVQLAQQYNKFAELGSQFGLVKKDQVNIEQYVTQKALDGVYLMMAKEEAAIRKDPVGQGSALLKKVFGVLVN